MQSTFFAERESGWRFNLVVGKPFSPLVLFGYFFLVSVAVCATPLFALEIAAQEQTLMVEDSIVGILGYKNGKVEKASTGDIAYRSDEDGYVLTNASVAHAADTLKVLPTLADTFDPQADSAEIIKSFSVEVVQIDYALLKVRGLDLSVMHFSNRFPAAGDAVWFVAKSTEADPLMKFGKGSVRSAYHLQSSDVGLLSHNALVLAVLVVLFIVRKRKPINNVRGSEGFTAGDEPNETIAHKPLLEEYVLDDRDESGIRYLLRISGDEMVTQDGIVIGRNPSDSPHTISHADVSRKHARMKVMKNRVFIEDLGSTNGTSVNGQSIDDRGLMSVHNGDQVSIGSVAMKLRVVGA